MILQQKDYKSHSQTEWLPHHHQKQYQENIV